MKLSRRAVVLYAIIGIVIGFSIGFIAGYFTNRRRSANSGVSEATKQRLMSLIEPENIQQFHR
jgi:Na+/H+-translocating membrane pyrophosphatase